MSDDIKLRPEFEILWTYFKRLYADIEVDQEFLRKTKDLVDVCEHIAETDKERAVIVRAKEWWNRRAERFGMEMSQKLLPAVQNAKGYTVDDLKFLKSLRVKRDDESGEAIGA